MRKEQRAVAGLEIDQFAGVRPVGFRSFNAQTVRADGVEEGLRFATAGDGSVDAALKGGGAGREDESDRDG